MTLEEAVQGLAPRLLGFCLARTGDRALAEDAAQEALGALVRRWRRSGPPESPEAFVFTIARRRAARAAVRQRLFEPLFGRLEERESSRQPEREAVGRESLAKTLEAVRHLPPKERDALLLVVVGELPLADGARLLGTSVPALKMRIHRARKRLVRLLEDHHERRAPGRVRFARATD